MISNKKLNKKIKIFKENQLMQCKANKLYQNKYKKLVLKIVN